MTPRERRRSLVESTWVTTVLQGNAPEALAPSPKGPPVILLMRSEPSAVSSHYSAFIS